MRTVQSLSLLPVWVEPEHRVSTARILLQGHKQKALGVLENGVLVGVVTAERLAAADDLDLVRDHMASPSVVIDGDTSIRAAAETFMIQNLDYAPLVGHGKFMGMLQPNVLLRELSRSWDPLTNLSWSDYLREWGMESLMNSKEITLIFIDLDDFGQFNKKFGHVVGDRVLRKMASMLEATIDPDRDILVRYGGDEFAIGSLRTREEANELVAKLREQSDEVLIDEQTEPVHFCVGLTGGKRTKEREDVHYAATLDNLINLASKECIAQKRSSIEKVQSEIRAKDEEERRVKMEVETRARAESEAKARAEAEIRAKTAEEARRRADEEAKKRGDEAAKLRAEAEGLAKAESEARKKAEIEAKHKVEVEARAKAAEEARNRAEAEAKERAAEVAQIKAEVLEREKDTAELEKQIDELEAKARLDEERRQQERDEEERQRKAREAEAMASTQPIDVEEPVAVMEEPALDQAAIDAAPAEQARVEEEIAHEEKAEEPTGTKPIPEIFKAPEGTENVNGATALIAIAETPKTEPSTSISPEEMQALEEIHAEPTNKATMVATALKPASLVEVFADDSSPSSLTQIIISVGESIFSGVHARMEGSVLDSVGLATVRALERGYPSRKMTVQSIKLLDENGQKVVAVSGHVSQGDSNTEVGGAEPVDRDLYRSVALATIKAFTASGE